MESTGMRRNDALRAALHAPPPAKALATLSCPSAAWPHPLPHNAKPPCYRRRVGAVWPQGQAGLWAALAEQAHVQQAGRPCQGGLPLQGHPAQHRAREPAGALCAELCCAFLLCCAVLCCTSVVGTHRSVLCAGGCLAPAFILTLHLQPYVCACPVRISATRRCKVMH